MGFSAPNTWLDLVRLSNCFLKPFTSGRLGAARLWRGCVSLSLGGAPLATAPADSSMEVSVYRLQGSTLSCSDTHSLIQAPLGAVYDGQSWALFWLFWS